MSTREAHLTLVDDLHFAAHSGSGHATHIDSPLEAGAAARGPSPVELVLEAVGGCGAMDVISILRKMRQEVATYEIDVLGERSDTHPKVYRRIDVLDRFTGTAISEANVRRAITLSISRYCPVYAMLAPTVQIEERYEIRDSVSGELEASGSVVCDPSESS